MAAVSFNTNRFCCQFIFYFCFLRLYRIGDFTFHIPCQKDEVNELEILDEEIDGEISAEKTRNVDINFRQAMLLLENYSGVKAAGTYNKKPEFY